MSGTKATYLFRELPDRSFINLRDLLGGLLGLLRCGFWDIVNTARDVYRAGTRSVDIPSWTEEALAFFSSSAFFFSFSFRRWFLLFFFSAGAGA